MPTFLSLQQQIQGFVGDKHADTLTKIKGWINEGRRDVLVAHEWSFKRTTGRFNTVAPYDTGLITATKGSATVTISGGVFTGLTGYKLAASVASTFFRIESVAGSGLSCTLEQPWTEESVTDSAFIAYLDEYDLGDEVESVEAVTLIKAGYPGMAFVPLLCLEGYRSTPDQVGVPIWFHEAAGGVNTVVLGLSPVPDDLYALDVRYERRFADLEDDADDFGLPPELAPCVIDYAHWRAAMLDHNPLQAEMAYRTYKRSLSEKIGQYEARTSADWQIRPAVRNGDYEGQPFPGGW